MLSYFNIRNLRNADIAGLLISVTEHAQTWFWWFRTNVVSKLADWLKIRTNRIASELAEVNILSLPQQAQTIESISGHTYIRKRISLTFFVKKLILWSERLSQTLLSDATCFVCRAVTFFNEIDLYPHSSYHLRNTIKLIRRSSSIIDEYIYSVRLHDIW